MAFNGVLLAICCVEPGDEDADEDVEAADDDASPFISPAFSLSHSFVDFINDEMILWDIKLLLPTLRLLFVANFVLLLLLLFV